MLENKSTPKCKKKIRAYYFILNCSLSQPNWDFFYISAFVRGVAKLVWYPGTYNSVTELFLVKIHHHFMLIGNK